MVRRALATLAASTLLLAACGGGGGNDGGALAGHSSTGPAAAGPTVTVDTAPGPATKDVQLQGSEAPLSWLAEFPELDPGPSSAAINANLRALEQTEIDQWRKTASGPHDTSLSCQTDTLLDSKQLFSVSTTCSSGTHKVAIIDATYLQSTGARLSLSDLLKGHYLRYLSRFAVLQLETGGSPGGQARRAAPATGAGFADWGIEPGSIDVAFPLPGGARSVSFSLDALAPYVRSSGPLRYR